MSDFQFMDTDNKPLNYGAAFNTYYTYSFINNALFYPLVPAPYIDFYQRFVRQWFYWYDGYVPYLHVQDNGIFSTRLATTLVKKVAAQINGGKLLLETNGDQNADANLKFAEEWMDLNDISNKIDSLVEFSAAGGTSLIKLNYDGKDLWMHPMRLDNYFVDTDWKGNVIDFTGFVQTFTQTIRKDQQNYVFYLLERRYFGDDNKPYIKYFVKRSTQNITTARDYNMSETQDIPYESLPKKVKQSIKEQFYGLALDVEQPLPFDNNLGVFLYKFTPHISNLPQLPYGESLFGTIISYLMSYDYYFSALNTNMYVGRSRVLMPKAMQNPNNQRENNWNDGLDSFTFTKVPYVNPDDQKPLPLQFDLRTADWNKIRNILLESIASSIGINPSTLASYLDDNTARTARQISTEEGATALFVENKRELLRTPINRMLNEVMKFYGKKPNIVVKFSKAGTTNLRNLVEIGQILKTLGVDNKTLVEMIFNDKSQQQIDEILRRMDEQAEKQQAMELQATEDPYMPQDNGNQPGLPSNTSAVPTAEPNE
jgi:hypothetical protein